ncbi:MAG: Toluene efflux pump periplasmic linker protein TtgG [Glaciecola sp. HTCC2999]|jgi:RND family efflux transporter MFP subunit|nr:MAG: Toluene efflux pump periplasmic linker protein TtgG [Glaciecola sp. HTCC2999]
MAKAQAQSSNEILLFILVGASVILLMILMMFSGAGSAKQDSTEVVVQIVDVTPVQYQDTLTKAYRAMGRIESMSQAMIGFERSGRVAQMLVEDGQKVKRGEVIAKLDTKRIDAQLVELNAALNIAQAEARLASISVSRIAALVRSKLESPQRLDDAKEANNIAQARLTQIKAQLETLSLELEKSTIVAPYTADIITRLVDEGAVVNVGQPVFEIANNATLIARIALPPKIAATLTVGNTYDLRVDDALVQGELLTMGSQRNLRTRTIDTQFSVPNANKNGIVGDLIAVDLSVTQTQRGIWVPISVLANGVRGMWNVFVVGNEGQTRIENRAVEIIYSDGERAFVTGALADGELLVVAGTHRFVSGQNVTARVSDITPNKSQ